MIQLGLFNDALPKHKLPTSITARSHPVHRWFNLIAGFSPEFVSSCISAAQLKERSGLLIDPFAGLSTGLVQANLEGVSSAGFEAHPFLYELSLAKLFPPSVEEVSGIEEFCRSFCPYTGELSGVWAREALDFLTKLVPDPELRMLATALVSESRVSPKLRSVYRLVISRVLEAASGSKTDGIYKAPTTRKKSLTFQTALSTACNELREDIRVTGGVYRTKATLFCQSSEDMGAVPDRSCSLCVTSPPYLNNFDYAEMTRMELYFWKYASCWSEITERVRRRLVVNTTTAPTDLKRDQEQFRRLLSTSFQARIEPLASALKDRKRLKPGKKDYDLLLYPYFAQIQNVLTELWRVLRPESDVHFVIGNAAFYGVHIPTESLLADLMQQNEFQVIRVELLRSRGDRWVLKKREGSIYGLGEFHIYARRQ